MDPPPPRPSETPPPPPSSAQVPKESAARRYKFVWPVLLAVNVAIGAYLFLNANKKDEKEVAEVVGGAPVSTASATVAVPEKTLPPEPTIVTAIPREPIPEDEQRNLFKWMLEEKRKVKAKNSEEKKHIDEEKAILKQFIRAKSLPTI
ncbi:unnamed protein product [Victoria cruziana]